MACDPLHSCLILLQRFRIHAVELFALFYAIVRNNTRAGAASLPSILIGNAMRS